MAQLILTLKGREIKRLVIEKTDTAIGRDPRAELCIDNAGVSRTHAVVRFREGIFTVDDFGSSNGLFVNGEQCKSHALADSDEIMVGKFLVVFEDRAGTSGTHEPVELEDNRGRLDLHETHEKPLVETTTQLSPDDMKRLFNLTPKLDEPAEERVRPAPPRSNVIPLLMALLLVALGAIVVLVALLVRK